MTQVITARKVAFSQKLVIFLVCCNFILIGGFAFLFESLASFGSLLVVGLLVFYNILLSWLVIHRSKRRGDRILVYAMVVSILLLGVTLVTRLLP